MSGLSICFKSFKRLSCSKFRRQTGCICVIRHKMDAAVLEADKISEFETIQYESSSLTWLYKVAPAFPIDGSKVTVIYEPFEFYSLLLQKIKTAKRRITLASLYLGTGKLENELVKSIKQTMDSSHGKVQVNILLDYMRGSRGKINSREMLKPLINQKFGSSCNVFLYHTPRLQGFLKTIIPDRFNELIGLQHMKLYLFDDTLIISGANLSNDYFDNRQDRYFMIENCEDLCNFYCSFVEKVTEFSFQLQPDGSTRYSNKTASHPFNSPSDEFISEASGKIHDLFRGEMDKRSNMNQDEISKKDTVIFPLVQMAQLNIRHDSEVTLKLLETVPTNATLRMTTGYFNLTTQYRSAILEHCRANCHLLTAHPTANGFFGAKGIAGGIPAAYTRIEESFFKLCANRKQLDRVQLWEFAKPGWTYHAKGLWYSLPGHSKPSLTLIGSPNFGYRSVERDLETQIALVTKNEQLQDSLEKEYARLFECATPVTKSTFTYKDRIPPMWVRVTVFFFRYFF